MFLEVIRHQCIHLHIPACHSTRSVIQEMKLSVALNECEDSQYKGMDNGE